MWLYVVLLHETVLLVPNLCLQYLAFQFYEFLKVTGLKFGCDSSKTPILTVFGVLLVIKRLEDHFICVILVVILETSRLVPWFRQLDHPIQRYHAPRAGKYNFPHKVRDLCLNFAIEPFLELTPPVCHFKIGFKWLRSTILQLQVHLCPKFGCVSP